MNEQEVPIKFTIPVDICKSQPNGSPDEDKRWIQGVASTEALDLSREIVMQNGIDTSHFLQYGFFNDDHKPGAEFKIGEPTVCKVTPNGLWVKGFLYKDNPRADVYWNAMQSMKKSGSKRRVGFSVQGIVKKRDNKVITSCMLQDVALTMSPMNPTTWAEIVKSFNGCSWSVTNAEVITPESIDRDIKEALVKDTSYADGFAGTTPAESVEFLIRKGHSLETAIEVVSMVFKI